VLWFWWPHADALAVPVALVHGRGGARLAAARRPMRRFCWSLLAMDAATTAAFIAYAAVGIDALNQYYTVTSTVRAGDRVLVIALSGSELLASATPRWRALAGTPSRRPRRCRLRRFAVAPQTRLSIDHVDPAARTPARSRTRRCRPACPDRRLAAGRPVVLSVASGAWPAGTGFSSRRSGRRPGVPWPTRNWSSC